MVQPVVPLLSCCVDLMRVLHLICCFVALSLHLASSEFDLPTFYSLGVGVGCRWSGRRGVVGVTPSPPPQLD